jgi:phospholipase/carboxylesterase
MPPLLGQDGPTTFGPHAIPGEQLARARVWRRFSADERKPSFEDSPEVVGWEPLAAVRVVTPMHYEPGYAYPALVWLPGEEETEHDAAAWIERVSDRNCIGVGLRPAMFESRTGGVESGLNRFRQVLRCVEASMHLHPSRRFVAGMGRNARVAIEWLLRRPEWFAGAVVIDAPREEAFAARVSAAPLLNRRVLWLQTTPTAPSDAPCAIREALASLGIEVECPSLDGVDPEAEALRFIDAWMLDCSEVPVVK